MGGICEPSNQKGRIAGGKSGWGVVNTIYAVRRAKTTPFKHPTREWETDQIGEKRRV